MKIIGPARYCHKILLHGNRNFLLTESLVVGREHDRVIMCAWSGPARSGPRDTAAGRGVLRVCVGGRGGLPTAAISGHIRSAGW
jgi:hypothetical protein